MASGFHQTGPNLTKLYWESETVEENPEAVLVFLHLLTLQGPNTGLENYLLRYSHYGLSTILAWSKQASFEDLQWGNRIYHLPILQLRKQAQRGLPRSTLLR